MDVSCIVARNDFLLDPHYSPPIERFPQSYVDSEFKTVKRSCAVLSTEQTTVLSNGLPHNRVRNRYSRVRDESHSECVSEGLVSLDGCLGQSTRIVTNRRMCAGIKPP